MGREAERKPATVGSQDWDDSRISQASLLLLFSESCVGCLFVGISFGSAVLWQPNSGQVLLKVQNFEFWSCGTQHQEETGHDTLPSRMSCLFSLIVARELRILSLKAKA